MDRRSFIRGLVAAPLVIRTPGILMPVKAVPEPFAYVRCMWMDGSESMKLVWSMQPASFVAAEPWFDDVASIISYEYTDKNPETNPYISNAEVFSSFSRKSGSPMLVPAQRMEYKPHKTIEYEDWELFAFNEIDKLKDESIKMSLDANGNKLIIESK